MERCGLGGSGHSLRQKSSESLHKTPPSSLRSGLITVLLRQGCRRGALRAPTTTIHSMAAGARMTMRAVLVAAVLVLGIAGDSGAAGAGASLPEVAVELLAAGFSAPVFLVAPDDGSGRRFVGEQAGVIYVVTAAGTRLETPFLDLRDRMVTLLEGSTSGGCLAWLSTRTSRPTACSMSTTAPSFAPGRRSRETRSTRGGSRNSTSWPRIQIVPIPPRSAPPPTRLGEPQAQWRRPRLRARWLPLPRAQ